MTQQERAVRTRRALIVSAAGTFGSRGYADATLNMISSGAGVSAGALHFHFENKAAVAAAVQQATVRSLCGMAQEVRTHRRSALQALVDTTYALAHALATDTVARSGVRLSREAGYRASVDFRLQWRHHVQLLLSEAAAEGALRPGVAHEDVASVVTAATIGFEELGRWDTHWLSRETLRSFWDLALPPLVTAEAERELDPGGATKAAEVFPGRW